MFIVVASIILAAAGYLLTRVRQYKNTRFLAATKREHNSLHFVIAAMKNSQLSLNSGLTDETWGLSCHTESFVLKPKFGWDRARLDMLSEDRTE